VDDAGFGGARERDAPAFTEFGWTDASAFACLLFLGERLVIAEPLSRLHHAGGVALRLRLAILDTTVSASAGLPRGSRPWPGGTMG
jgi:hypothetical protein